MPKKIDITHHRLVPPHKRITKEEVDALLKKYNISLLQLPVILLNDPIVKVLGAKPGDVIQIKRSGTLGEYAYYRRVTEHV